MDAQRPIYLNHAAASWPKPPGVVEAVAAALRRPPEDPGRSPGDGADADVALRGRRALAALLGVPDPARIALTAGATHALNLAILGLAPRLTRVVTTVTEHNSVLRPLWRLRRSAGIDLEVVGLGADGGLDREAWTRALARPADLAVLNHASNVTGRVNPVAECFAAARAAGARTLLDAAQTMGRVPVRPLELQADLVAFPGHKGLWGPPGTGGLWVAPGIELEQVLVGGTGVRGLSEAHPPDMPLRLEAGTPDTPAVAGLVAGLEWLVAAGAGLARQAEAALRRLRDGLRAIPAARVVDPAEAPRVGVLSLRLAGWEVDEAAFVLRESFGIVTRAGLHCAPLLHPALGTAPEGTLRLSVSGLTTEADVDAALAALRRMAR